MPATRCRKEASCAISILGFEGGPSDTRSASSQTRAAGTPEQCVARRSGGGGAGGPAAAAWSSVCWAAFWAGRHPRQAGAIPPTSQHRTPEGRQGAVFTSRSKPHQASKRMRETKRQDLVKCMMHVHSRHATILQMHTCALLCRPPCPGHRFCFAPTHLSCPASLREGSRERGGDARDRRGANREGAGSCGVGEEAG